MGIAKALVLVGALTQPAGLAFAGETALSPGQPQIGSDLWFDLYVGFHLTSPVYRPDIDPVALCLAPKRQVHASRRSDDVCKVIPNVFDVRGLATAISE